MSWSASVLSKFVEGLKNYTVVRFTESVSLATMDQTYEVPLGAPNEWVQQLAASQIVALTARDAAFSGVATGPVAPPTVVAALTARGLYVINTGSLTHVAAATTLMLDLFNAHATRIVRIRSIRHAPLIEAAVTGVGMRFQLLQTTAVGTGGSVISGVKLDSTYPGLEATITARSKGTGGATAGSSLMWWNVTSEETLAPVNCDVIEVLPQVWQDNGIVLRQNQGIRINQETNSAVGASALIVTIEVNNS